MSDVETQVTPFTFGPRNERGVCSVCGKPAYKGSSTKCEDHRTSKPKAKPAETTAPGETKVTVNPDGEIKVDRPTPVGPKASEKSDDKERRAKEIERSILADLNPMIPQGMAFICRPVNPEVFYSTTEKGDVVPTDIGKQSMFADWEAKALGKSVAELESSNVGMAVGGIVKPILPIAWALAGVGVVLFHGYSILTTRQTLLIQYAEWQRQEAAKQAGGTPMPPAGGDGDPAPPPATVNGSQPPLRPVYQEGDLAS